MDDLGHAFLAALTLLATGDGDLYAIALRSLFVTLTAITIAAAIGLPLGAWLALRRFPGRRAVIATLNALMGLPPVVVGLTLYLLLSRSGPLGALGLLYTPWAMILAQLIIALPIIASIAHQTLRELWAEYHDLLIALNTTPVQRLRTLLWDGRRALLTAILAGFGRAIGEVGAVMIVGGNIDQVTRVLTTAISLETSRGNFALALGLGIILLALALGVNLAVHGLARTERRGRW
ncbi:MAG: ABC transporter permease [Jannaschia sp.]